MNVAYTLAFFVCLFFVSVAAKKQRHPTDREVSVWQAYNRLKLKSTREKMEANEVSFFDEISL